MLVGRWRASQRKASLARPGSALHQVILPCIKVIMTDATLERYRQSIDNIDAALVFILAERFKVTQAVGRHKAEHGLPPADPGREEAQIERLRGLAQAADLDPEFSEKFLRFIIDEVIRHHEKARDEG
jgi:chorismate mutase